MAIATDDMVDPKGRVRFGIPDSTRLRSASSPSDNMRVSTFSAQSRLLPIAQGLAEEFREADIHI